MSCSKSVVVANSSDLPGLMGNCSHRPALGLYMRGGFSGQMAIKGSMKSVAAMFTEGPLARGLSFDDEHYR
eukprot:3629838-Amphidinium_carterae.1